MKIAVIGCGVSGLACIRRIIEYEMECIAFEATENIGGIWVYNESNADVKLDCSSSSCLYDCLKTNLPTQLMEFPGYTFNSVGGNSFVSHEEVLKYLKSFAHKYDLYPYIKFGYCVKMISRIDDVWKIAVKNLNRNVIEEYECNGVMDCTGHYAVPKIINIPGIETFKGHQIHSKYFRKNDLYVNKHVLIVGSGSSGLDISIQCSYVAEQVFLSHHNKIVKCDELGTNIKTVPDVDRVENNVVHFSDSTSVIVDAIIYCTGYKYGLSHLHSSCQIEISENIVSPLYKYFINILQPSMCLIGLVRNTIVFPIVDLQAEAFVKIIKNIIKLPTKDEMFKDEQLIMLQKKISKEPYFSLGVQGVEDYISTLSSLANIKRIPPVVMKIYRKCREAYINDYKNLKNLMFEIVDDETYISWIK